MTFTSLSFMLFFAVLFVLYFVLPKKMQWLILLVFSYLFYFFASEKLPVYMLLTTVVTYLSARYMQSIKDKANDLIKTSTDLDTETKRLLRKKSKSKSKTVLIADICINLGILAVFKYTDFVFSNISSLLCVFGANLPKVQFNLLLPLGISFYTFQSIGYVVDVYRNQAKAETDFFKTALFISYFPQIIQGPIGRFNALAPQLTEKHTFSFEKTKRAAFLILWGFLKKLVIADNLAPMISEISENYSLYSGLTVFIGLLLYGIQLYADFSGYMDIASGFSDILGIEIAQNFNRPYFSRNLAEFWRRWHMSLCSWFRDYLFYPMFMSGPFMRLAKKLRAKGYKTAATNVPTFIAMAIVWFLTGLWHGACWTEIIWGFSNGLIMIFSLQFKNVYTAVNQKLHIDTEAWKWKVFQIVRTYLLVTLLNFICEFNTLRDSVTSFSLIIRDPIPATWSASSLFPRLIDAGVIPFVAVFAACSLFFFHSLYEEKRGSVVEAICAKHWIIQTGVFVFVLFYIILFGQASNDMTGGFMYAQF